MTSIKIFELLTIILGLAASFNAGYWFHYFRGSKYPLGRAVAWVTLGEAVSIVVISSLAVMSFTSSVSAANAWLVLTFRSLMFLIAILTTLHLAIRVSQLMTIIQKQKIKNVAHEEQVTAAAVVLQHDLHEIEQARIHIDQLNVRLANILKEEVAP